jgi:polyphenol oxidase
MELVWLQVPKWEKQEGLLHGFLGRRGGKSAGPYATLNLAFGVGDDKQTVKDNLCDMKRAVGIHDRRIVTMKQVHGDGILEISDGRLKQAGEADGMVTAASDIYLGVLTADCVPILFAAPERRVAAAVHAGWRGTLSGIAIKMIAYLGERYSLSPAALEVALGPSIGSCCYEIGADVSVPMIQRWKGLAERTLESRDGKTFLDLRELNSLQLREAGVPPEKIHRVDPCTSCAADDFFSYRRERRATGHQMSFIGWQ